MRKGKRKLKPDFLIVLILLLIMAILFGIKIWQHQQKKGAAETARLEEQNAIRQEKLDQAAYLAATYDYDGAIATLNTVREAASDEEVQSLIAEYEKIKESCEPVKLEEVTHIFYHSLVVDPERAFANQDTNRQAAGNNQWMTTVSEFHKITQEMYDRGYVMVDIHDLYEEVTDENGEVTFEPGTILLPPGKKAFVLSVDDLSYYHAYEGYGYASKLIVGEDGQVTNEYVDAEGNTLIGAYDVVPLMDQFVEEHPDASYHGAKGTIALTGYNGILGYRTDETYDLNNPDCDIHQKKWIETHEDFNLEQERTEAKKVADAMKANGWEFASHTWGHLKVGERTLETLQADTEKWKRNVEPLVGSTDTIIFAHGQDLQSKGEYDSSNPKVSYFKSEGYKIFCNVDASPHETLLGKDYMRQGRRNLDGYRIYYNAIGQQDNLSDLFDAKEILDSARPPVPAL